MRFSLVVEHTDRVRPRPAPQTGGQNSEQFIMLDAGCLSDAARLATRLDSGAPLLRIHVTDAHPAPGATEIFLPPRQTAIVSLIHDASLLGIAVGALITIDESAACPHSMRDGITKELDSLGYLIRTDRDAEPVDQSTQDRVE